MGTNYYLHKKTCPCCKKPDEVLHIGKSSGGWCFSLHVIPEEGINDLDDWMPLFEDPGNVILNEYDEVIPAEIMRGEITERSWMEREGAPYGYGSWAEFHRQNDSEPGPNGLLRHKINRYCTKHGAGTWDCLPGEYS